MAKKTMGLVALACPYESGGERAEELIVRAAKSLEQEGMDLEIAHQVVWTGKDALEVCQQFEKAEVSSVAVIETTWIMDSVKYLLVHKLKVPMVFWAVPYAETFSFASIQHFGAILTSQGIHFEYVFGLPGDPVITEQLKKISCVGEMIREIHSLNLALLGPRQTWRVAGPQDMSNEEWEYSRKMGPTILHLEMEEVLGRIEKITDKKARKVLDELLPRTGNSLLSEKSMLRQVKTYLAVKDIMAVNHVQVIAGECYPQFGGLLELTASWLADEGIQVDTEGDISHSVLMHLLYHFTKGKTALCEAGSIDKKRNLVIGAHAGSSAQSLTGDYKLAQISPCTEQGAFVGTPLKAMDCVTVLSFTGKSGDYKMLIGKGRTLEIPREEWVANGEKMMVHLQFQKEVDVVMRSMFEEGMDHHLLIHEGDCTELMELFCDYMGIQKVFVD